MKTEVLSLWFSLAALLLAAAAWHRPIWLQARRERIQSERAQRVRLHELEWKAAGHTCPPPPLDEDYWIGGAP